ncbi:MAG: glycosyltransferase family 4 protein [Acidobacteria bacterium]|nr:glycosyltransferase family 4 protein [Acidobacteriota bacterium]
MTRILMIANTLPPADISGVGEQVLQLAAGLRDRGLEVEVLGRRGRGGEHRTGARGPKVLFPLAIVPAVWRRLREFRPDVVQVHESDGAFAALITVLLRPWLAFRGGPRPKLIALLQVSYVREMRATRPLTDRGRVIGLPGKVERRFRWFKGPLQVQLGRLTARLADQVLAPSQVTARELEKDYRVGPVAVLPNVTGGLPVQPEPCPALVGEPPGYLLFVGRLRVRKGVEVLLEALAGTTDVLASGRLLIAGDGEHREALESCSARLGLGERVRFLGRTTPGQVRTLLASASALVVPSIYEGMPLVVLEAMEAAVPVVASRVSGIPEVVVDGETGWVVRPENTKVLRAALRQVLDAPPEARRRGAAGRERLDRLYRPAVSAALWHDQVLGSYPVGEETA